MAFADVSDVWTCDGTCNQNYTQHVFPSVDTLNEHKELHHGPVAVTTKDPSTIVYNMEQIARKFHAMYEGHAPRFGYETKKEYQVPWEKLSARYKLLIMTTVVEIFEDLDLLIR